MNKNKNKNDTNNKNNNKNKHSNNKRLGSFPICRRARSAADAADARRVAADASDARWRQTHFRGDARF